MQDSGLQKLIAKIEKDARQKAEDIISAAKAQADALVAESEKQAELSMAEAERAAGAEAERLKTQIDSQTQLERRNLELREKQNLIDGIMGDALKKLNALPDAELLAYITSSLKDEKDLGEQELLLPAKSGLDANAVTKALKKAGIQCQLAPYTGSRGIGGGFMLFKDGIERNFSFETFLEYKRGDFVADIVEIVF